MATHTEIPVTFTAEATERIAELGLQNEVQQMIEHVKQAVPDVVAIDVEQWYDYESGGPAFLTIRVWKPGVMHSLDDFGPADEWHTWLYRTYPADVRQWFTFDLLFRDEHGRPDLP